MNAVTIYKGFLLIDGSEVGVAVQVLFWNSGVRFDAISLEHIPKH